MNVKMRETLSILIESPFWEFLTPREKLRFLQLTDDLLEDKRMERVRLVNGVSAFSSWMRRGNGL